MAMDIEGVNVTAASVIKATREEYLEVVGNLVHRNALLQAAVDTMAADLAEARSRIAALEEIADVSE